MTHQVGLHHVLSAASRTHGARTAIFDGDTTWSFEQLDEQVGHLAASLAAQGVRRGQRVAILMGNGVEFLLVVLALSRLGAVAVLLSPAWKSREIGHALTITAAALVVVDDAAVGAELERSGTAVVTIGPAERQIDAPGRMDVPEVSSVDDAVLVFSSGTTGLPKAVRHTASSLLAATDHWVSALGLGPEDRFQVSTPPSHILGLLNLLAALRAGARVRLHRRFDLDVELRSIEADRMTLEMAVAPIMLAMAGHPDIERYDLSSLRFIMWGATPVTASVAEVVTARTGVPVLAAYGASEVPVLAVNPVDAPSTWRLDSPGLPPSGVELRVVDPRSGQVLPAGSTGELEARAPSLMAGYLPASADGDAFHDGWYRTGDIGTLEPGGWVRLTDRWKDMIKVNGFQVAPAEIEAVLLGHHAVVDCAVFGVPDDATGESPVAAVQLDPNIGVAPGELEALVAQDLAGYKRLRCVVPIDAIPRLASGKSLRRELRRLWLEDTLQPIVVPSAPAAQIPIPPSGPLPPQGQPTSTWEHRE